MIRGDEIYQQELEPCRVTRLLQTTTDKELMESGQVDVEQVPCYPDAFNEDFVKHLQPNIKYLCMGLVVLACVMHLLIYKWRWVSHYCFYPDITFVVLD